MTLDERGLAITLSDYIAYSPKTFDKLKDKMIGKKITAMKYAENDGDFYGIQLALEDGTVIDLDAVWQNDGTARLEVEISQ